MFRNNPWHPTPKKLAAKLVSELTSSSFDEKHTGDKVPLASSSNSHLHESFFSAAYDFVKKHEAATEIAIGTAVVAGGTLVLHHYMPTAVAEKISAKGAEILEKTLGTSAPHSVLEFKALPGSESVEDLLHSLRNKDGASHVLQVQSLDSKTPHSLLIQHSPIDAARASEVDKIATCSLPAGCETKGVFADQKGQLFLHGDSTRQTIQLSDTAESLVHRAGRALHGDFRAWVPLGPQGSSELRSLATDRSVMPMLNSAPPLDAQAKRIKDIGDRWEARQSIISTVRDIQDHATQLVRTVLGEEQRAGRISSDWRFVATQQHSALDKSGADAIFYNSKTGEAHLMDYSSHPQKRVRGPEEASTVRRAGIIDRNSATEDEMAGYQGDSRIPLVRTNGLMGMDRKWFDQMGKLDIEQPKAAIFRQEIGIHLSDLTQAPAYFNLKNTPFPDILQKDPVEQVQQLKAFKEWSLAEAAKSDSLHPRGYREFANANESAITYLNANAVKKADATYFNGVAGRVAEQSIFRWAVEKTMSTMTDLRSGAQEVTGRAQLAFASAGQRLDWVPKQNYLSFKHDEQVYSTGQIVGDNGMLDQARKRLMGSETMKEHVAQLTAKQKSPLIALVKRKGRQGTDEDIARELSGILMTSQGEIKAGGQLGMIREGSTPPLVENLRSRLQTLNPATLTKPLDVATESKVAAQPVTPVDAPSNVTGGFKPDPKKLPRMQ